MNSTILSVISYLLPLAAGVLGAITILNNRHRGVSRSLLALLILCAAYKGGYDIITTFGLADIQIIAYLASILALFSVAPLLYKYFQSLLDSEFEISKPDIKHFSVPVSFFIISFIIVFTVPQNEVLAVLNHRFEKGFQFERNLPLMTIYMIGYPLLVVQWLIYLRATSNLIKKQKKTYGKFYGSFEKRNETLILRLYLYLAAIFIISFVIFFLQISNELLIFTSNMIITLLMTLSVYFGREQVSMKKYRMYKLSSHEEDIRKESEKISN